MTERSGDERAFLGLLEAHGGAILAAIRHLCGNPDDADDVFQETAIRVWRALRARPRLRSPRGWLMTIAYRSFLDHRARRDPRHAPDDRPDDRPDGRAVDPAERAIRVEDADRVRVLVADLPEPIRDVVALHYAGGLSLRETARALGISVGTAKSRLNNALERMRQAMRDRIGDRTGDGIGNRMGEASP
ncbi:MAG: RNA polymerase sigma factor [Planctomycetes bacterium]|nr:RNA polymerase sigma factor [Planctomycetota bacterium]